MLEKKCQSADVSPFKSFGEELNKQHREKNNNES